MTTYFEDFAPGQVLELGSTQVSAEEIVAFARQFDPQPFHVDAPAAALSPFGGLVASGWHTASMWMRLYVDAVLRDSASLGSPGVEELRWLRPVRPGDVLSGRFVVKAVRPSASKPDRGTVVFHGELVNGAGEVVMTMRARGLFARRALIEAPEP